MFLYCSTSGSMMTGDKPVREIFEIHYTQMQQVIHGADDDDDTVVVDVYNGADDNIDATNATS